MTIRVEQAPDWLNIMADLQYTKASLLLFAATTMIMKCALQIRSGLTLEGGAQKKNSDTWEKTKERRGITPNVPLVFSGDLSDVNKWLINGQPASAFMKGGPGRRVSGGGSAQFHRGYKIDFVTVRLPRNRDNIAHELQLMGYAVPFGITAEMRADIHRFGEWEIGRHVHTARHFVTGRQAARLGARGLDVESPQNEFRATFREVL